MGERGHWWDLGVDRKIILRRIFGKWERVETERSCLRIGTDGGHFWIRWWTFGFHKLRVISLLAAEAVDFSRRILLHVVSKKERLKFQFQTLSNNKEDYMRKFGVWDILITVHILCAARSWMNVNVYWICIVIECEIARWWHCKCLVEFTKTT